MKIHPFYTSDFVFVLSFCSLHKFLLQPRGVKPVESVSNDGANQVSSVKAKKVVGKIRVEGMFIYILFYIIDMVLVLLL